jgi:N-acetyl-gamma-glutamylphosphate reductase
MATSGESNQRSAPIQPSFNTLQFGTMSDSQLRQTINQLSHAASGTQYQAYAAPTPQRTAGKRPSLFAGFLCIVHHRARNSIPKKHRQLVNILDSSTAYRLAAQPSCEK